MDNDDVIGTLNDLIVTVRDGQNGFEAAVEGIRDPHVKGAFLEYAREREQMVRELQDEVRGLGGDPQKAGILTASLHRGWINIRSIVSGGDEHAIIAEAERGEDVAMAEFARALEQPLPAQVLALVQRQAALVRQAHDRVRAMEKAGMS